MCRIGKIESDVMTASAQSGAVGGERSHLTIPDIEIPQRGMITTKMFKTGCDSDSQMSECGTDDGETIKTPMYLVDDGEWMQVAASEVKVSAN